MQLLHDCGWKHPAKRACVWLVLRSQHKTLSKRKAWGLKMAMLLAGIRHPDPADLRQ